MRYIRKFILLISGLLLLIGCHKENSTEWVVLASGVVPAADHMVLLSDCDFCDSNPYIFESGSDNILWEEDHSLESTFWGNSYDKQIIFEIPDSLGLSYFYYQDEDIYKSINCGVYYFASGSNYDGYYRIHKGFISGEKISGKWEIDFRIFFGGSNNDKFKMTKDANY